MSMVQAVKFTPTTTPTVLGLSISWKISLQRFCFAKSNFYSGQNIMKMWSEVNLGHEGDAERKGGADHKGLKKLQSAGKTHLHNVGKQIDWSKLWTDPGLMDQLKKWSFSILILIFAWVEALLELSVVCQSLALKNPLDPCKEKGAQLSLIPERNVCFWEMRIVTLYQAVLVLEVSPQVMMNHHFVVPLTMDHLCAKVNTGNYIVGNFTLLLRGRKIGWFRRSSRSLWISSNVWKVGKSSR